MFEHKHQIQKNFNFIKKNIMFYEFDTIKHIKNFPKYGICNCVWKKCLFSKKSTVLFGTWYDNNSRGSLYKKYMLTHSMGLINNLEKIDYLNENEIQKLDPLTFNGLEIYWFKLESY